MEFCRAQLSTWHSRIMSDLFPADPKRIRERIRRYERALKKELEAGNGGDGYGKRFLLGPLYMLLGDVDGALASFDWYEEAYPDDSGEPYQYLTWALVLFRGGRRQEAFTKLYQTMLENLYLVTFLLDQNPRRLDVWHGSNMEWIEYAVAVPKELLGLWDDIDLQWAREVSEHPAVAQNVARYVAFHRELKSEPPGPRRSALVRESFALKTTLIP
jgi:tetratricopeptide (TPR) repeat protein